MLVTHRLGLYKETHERAKAVVTFTSVGDAGPCMGVCLVRKPRMEKPQPVLEITIRDREGVTIQNISYVNWLSHAYVSYNWLKMFPRDRRKGIEETVLLVFRCVERRVVYRSKQDQRYGEGMEKSESRKKPQAHQPNAGINDAVRSALSRSSDRHQGSQ